MKVLGKRVLVKIEEEKDEVVDGIWRAAGSVVSNYVKATVLSKGGEVTEVKEGQTIIFGRGSSFDFKLEGERYSIVNEESILAILE